MPYTRVTRELLASIGDAKQACTDYEAMLAATFSANYFSMKAQLCCIMTKLSHGVTCKGSLTELSMAFI